MPKTFKDTAMTAPATSPKEGRWFIAFVLCLILTILLMLSAKSNADLIACLLIGVLTFGGSILIRKIFPSIGYVWCTVGAIVIMIFISVLAVSLIGLNRPKEHPKFQLIQPYR
jgi:hypothetical protein